LKDLKPLKDLVLDPTAAEFRLYQDGPRKIGKKKREDLLALSEFLDSEAAKAYYRGLEADAELDSESEVETESTSSDADDAE